MGKKNNGLYRGKIYATGNETVPRGQSWKAFFAAPSIRWSDAMHSDKK